VFDTAIKINIEKNAMRLLEKEAGRKHRATNPAWKPVSAMFPITMPS